MTNHPLTETDAAELWDEHHTPAHPILRWALAHESERKATLALLRAAFDAGQKYQDDLEDDTIRNIMQDVHHLRVERDAAIAREAMQNMRESEQGRELMAEAWEEGALHQARGSAETRRVLASALPNPYRGGDA